MTIPGIQDFYDGMHQQTIHEMEQARQDLEHHEQPQNDHSEHAPQHSDHDHALGEHRISGDILGASHQNQQESHETGLLGHLVPAALTGIATAATRIVAEYLTEAAVSGALLGEGEVIPQHYPGDSLHVGSIEHGEFHHQTDRYSCALASPKMILDSFNAVDEHGSPFSEVHLTYLATANGWFNGKGMSLDHVGDLLRICGIPAHEGHGLESLIHELASGHQVVMSVNQQNLWGEHTPFSEIIHLIGNSPNHAIVVKGLRLSDHNKVVVVINDPGQANGAGVEYPLEHFQSAVDGSKLYYVATDNAPQDWESRTEVQNMLTEAHQNANTNPAAAPSVFFSDLLSQMTDAEHSNFLRNI